MNNMEYNDTMNNMEYSRRINEKFEKGLADGRKGIYKPGMILFGVFRKAYLDGHREGKRIRRLADFKTK